MTIPCSRLTAVTALASLGALGVAFAEINGSKGHADERAEAALVHRAMHSLADAIITAEKRANGFATEAELEIENGKAVYEIETVSKFGSFEAKIDADTGIVLEVKPEDSIDIQLAVIEALPLSVQNAIKAAEADTDAKAMEAELDIENGRLVFEVKLASSDGQTTYAIVDAHTAEVQRSRPNFVGERDDD